MDPYLWTWLARWGGACALSVAWCALAVAEARTSRARASVLAILGLVTGGVLWTHLGPLLTRAPLPDEPTALAVVTAAPFLAFSALALLRPAWPGRRFDLAAIAPVVTWPYGGSAWLFAVVLLGRGLTLPGAGRRRLVVGTLALGLAAGLHAERGDVEHLLPLGGDDAPRAAALIVSASETCGWALVTAGLTSPLTPGRRSDQSPT